MQRRAGETFMKHITCIEDLREAAPAQDRPKARLASITAPIPSRRCTPTWTICRRSNSGNAFSSISLGSRSKDDDFRRACQSMPLILAPVARDRPACTWATARIPGLSRGAGGRHPLDTLVDHVDLLDRGCRRQCRETVLVSALHDEGSRLFAGPSIERAIAAKCSALVLTVSTWKILGQRHMQTSRTACRCRRT